MQHGGRGRGAHGETCRVLQVVQVLGLVLQVVQVLLLLLLLERRGGTGLIRGGRSQRRSMLAWLQHERVTRECSPGFRLASEGAAAPRPSAGS